MFVQWDEQFVVKELQMVMKLDSLVTSHPIQQPVTRVGDIMDNFDMISYQKVRVHQRCSRVQNFQKLPKLRPRHYLFSLNLMSSQYLLSPNPSPG